MYIRLIFSMLAASIGWVACCPTPASAQQDSTRKPLQIHGYLEAFYVYDFGRPENHDRPDFLYSYDRHNEVNVNMALLRASFANTQLRANLGLMVGTYANANLAAEPGVLKNLFEANIGVKLSKKHHLWLDLGVFASHIGFESAIGEDCWNLSRSISAENSPYYFSGAKATYVSPNEQWLVSGLLLNGWQRIQRLPGNSLPALGHQLQWKPTKGVVLNSSSFVGSDTPDSVRTLRFFHDFYGQFQWGEKWGAILGFDIGAQQKTQGSRAYNVWYSPVVIVRYMPCNRLAMAARAEYYSDPHGTIVPTGTPNGLGTFGCSFNVDLRVAGKILWRSEIRWLRNHPDQLFEDRGSLSYDNWALGTSFSISL
jgi:hypothetical protein